MISELAEFDGELMEAFARNWRDNQNFAHSLEETAAITSTFNEGADAAEDFEIDWTPADTI